MQAGFDGLCEVYYRGVAVAPILEAHAG